MALGDRVFAVSRTSSVIAEDRRRDGRASYLRRVEALAGGAAKLNLDVDSIHLALEIADLEPDLKEHLRFALIVLILISLAALEQGSTRFPVAGGRSNGAMTEVLGTLCGESLDEQGRERLAGRIGELLKSDAAPTVIGRNEGDYKPLLYLPPYICHQRSHATEKALAESLVKFFGAPVGTGVDDGALREALSDVAGKRPLIDGKAVELSTEQLRAVKAAAQLNFALISGGPGTGKTSIVTAIVRVLVRLGVPIENIALTAPTGKAAYRMGETIAAALSSIEQPADADERIRQAAPPVSTIHRLLGYSPAGDRFRHHRDNPLPARAVIVDESSMLDVTLMNRLVSALRSDSRLIFLGDKNQLPSVSAGVVFRDLLDSTRSSRASKKGRSPTRYVELSRNYRTERDEVEGARIFAFGEAVNQGRQDIFDVPNGARDALVARRRSAADVRFAGVEFLEAGRSALAELLDRWFEERIKGLHEINELMSFEYTQDEEGWVPDDAARLERIFNYTEAARVLCLTRVFETGSDRINQRLHDRAVIRARGRDRSYFVSGEPLIVLRNDYERMLFNGDQGVVLNVKRRHAKAAPMAVFRRTRRFQAFPFSGWGAQIQLSYAMTVHKAQGSELDFCLLLLPAEGMPLLSREVLYTAVTRSRRSVVVVGREDLLLSAIGRRTERYSGLAEQLSRALVDAHA